MHLKSARALQFIGFKSTVKGAVIIGGLAGFLIAVQGLAFAATYPTAESRHQLAASLEGAPVLGILYGATNDLATPGHYMVYRVLAVMTLIAGIWGLTTSIKLLRGQEEDGRLELAATGVVTRLGVTAHLMTGYTASILLAYIIATSATTLAGMSPDVNVSITDSSLLTLAIFLPTLVFASIGALISQFTASRRRAVFYGFLVLLFLFGLRAIGNTVEDAHFLKSFTPFGWSDLINPIVNIEPVWIIPFIATILALTPLYLLLCRSRDVGTGILSESTTAKSHFFLLRSPLALAIRHNSPVIFAWTIGAAALSILMASIANIATNALADSPALKNIVASFGNANDLTIAFMGAGLIFTVVLLLIMATIGIGSIRNDESRGFLDTVFANPIGQRSWLAKRLVLTVLASSFVGVFSCLVTWVVARTQNIPIELGDILLVGISLSGTVLFLTGFGALLYGLIPRFATAGMYIVITWSTIIDMLRSSIDIDEWVVKTSLFHYVSISPTANPDWTAFAWLASLGCLMAVIGIITFSRRDIIGE